MGTVYGLKRNEIWKKSVFHFSLCFAVGFFVGIVPPGKPSSDQVADGRTFVADRRGALDEFHTVEKNLPPGRVNATTLAKPFPVSSEEKPATSAAIAAVEEEAIPELTPRRLLIVVTTTKAKDPFQNLFLRRLANTLRLVPPPLLWIVVESHCEAARTAGTLRTTGVMYRHLVFGETFSDPQAEIHHQRNIALNHIEDHRLSGIVHFSCLSDAYDLQFFDEIRGIEAFGTWPAASVSASEKQVVVEGPVCRSSRIVGWYLAAPSGGGNPAAPPPLDLYSFAFNSSILWDPDRWVRPTNLPDISQDSVRFLQEVVAEDDTKLRAFPSPDCSRILTWRLRSPARIAIPGRHPDPGRRL
ncbi:unnamed protein product [Spirodela intermedia]|uniref:Glycosyltransferases n=1 Tax=Spirodela intermedia TaxID=51605 RepID=A0A7I8KK55_SPIIN|nr:unnamed protein product [Spirodela intermedia]